MKLHKRIMLMVRIFLLAMPGPLLALKTDRQQPLEVNADSTDGTLGDGIATLKGNVEIRQGTLLIQADIAEVEKVDGKVRRFELNGTRYTCSRKSKKKGW